MRRPRVRRMRRPEGRHLAVAAALAGLLLLDLVLVGFALNGPDTPDAQVTSRLSPTETTAPAEDTAESAAPQQTATRTGPTGTLVDLGRDGAIAWARTGECGGRPPRLRLAADGTTFRTVDTPATSLQRIAAIDANETWAVGTDDTCTPRFLRTTDGGQTWDVLEDSGDAWHLMPAPSQEIHAPNGTVPSPCPHEEAPTDLAVYASEGAVVLCPDGSLRRTDDAGDTWTKIGTADGVRTITYLDQDQAAAATPTDGCTGVAIETSTDGGETWQPRGCADGADPDMAAVAYATENDGVIADADRVLITDDGGGSWQQVSTR